MEKIKITNFTQFLFGGHAVFSVVDENKNHTTFKVTPTAEIIKRWIVKKLSKSNNYIPVGQITGGKFKTIFGSEKGEEFNKFLSIFNSLPNIPKGLTIIPESMCARCGRVLTNPNSVQNGFGPECIKHIGGSNYGIM